MDDNFRSQDRSSCINITAIIQAHEILMYQKFLLSLVLLSLGLLPACGFVSHQSIYEGVRGNEKAKTTGTPQKPSALPNYDQYEKEREVLKNKFLDKENRTL